MHDNICSRADKELTNTGAMNEVSKPLDPQQVRLLSIFYFFFLAHALIQLLFSLFLMRSMGAWFPTWIVPKPAYYCRQVDSTRCQLFLDVYNARRPIFSYLPNPVFSFILLWRFSR